MKGSLQYWRITSSRKTPQCCLRHPCRGDYTIMLKDICSFLKNYFNIQGCWCSLSGSTRLVPSRRVLSDGWPGNDDGWPGENISRSLRLSLNDDVRYPSINYTQGQDPPRHN